MIDSQLRLSQNQIRTIDDFLVYGTHKAIEALELMFGLHIDNSHSTIEIASVRSSHNLHFLMSEDLHIVSSAMSGELNGHIVLLMRSSDYQSWCNMLRPVLNLLYLSNADKDLAALDRDKPDWLENGDACLHDESFKAAMTDALHELGNVLFGIYTRAISSVLHLEAVHSVPRTTLSPDGQILMRDTSQVDTMDQMQLIIQNDFTVGDTHLKLWCLISPTRETFEKMLQRIDRPAGGRGDQHRPSPLSLRCDPA